MPATLAPAHSAVRVGLWYLRTMCPEPHLRIVSEGPATKRPVAAPAPVDYPCSDGRPMAESDFRLIPLLYALTALRAHFGDRADVYVAGDMFVYFREGDPRAVVAPDVFVVIGAPKHQRHSFKLWEEPKGPDFVLEVTSRSTREDDEGRKRDLYAALEVGEYWLYDPTGECLAPRLQGHRLDGGAYRPLARVRTMDGGWSLHSPALGLDLRLEAGGGLRLHDPVSGEDLPAYAEMRIRVEQECAARRTAEVRLGEAQVRLEQEIVARDARIAELEARLEGNR